MKFYPVLLAAFAGQSLVAQETSLVALPVRPAPGSIVELTLKAVDAVDSVVAVSGYMSGERLHFARSASGAWRALGPVSVDATDSVPARVAVRRASGDVDSVVVFVTLPRRPPATATAPARRRQLAVNPRFTQPMNAETEARIARENERARGVGRNAHDTPVMWTESFINPRPSSITSRFGSGRMFNGTLSSRHLGVDFSGAVGTPVRAANRGVVALVDDFYLAGKVIYLDHGAGIVTGYFHLSRTLVAPGDTVQKGQQIALVGASGRVTGPHLHWNARYGAVTVNPLDLVRIGAR